MNISNISNWNQYIGDNTSQDYILSSSISFTSISGTINLQAGRTFDGQNNKIYLNNINNFNGLFNLHSSNTLTTIKNLQIICSNVSLNDFNGILVRGSSNNTILSNGNIDNVHIIFKNGSFGNLCGGIIGCSSKNINITNCHVDIGKQNLFTSNSGGGLIGGNAGVVGTITLDNCFFKGSLSNNTGGLVGNNSIISSIKNSYIIGSASNNNEISLGNTLISSSFNVHSSASINKLTNNTNNLSDIVNLTENLDIPSNKTYQINGNTILSSTSLGSIVNTSSFRTLGTLDMLNVVGSSTLGNVQSDLYTLTGTLSNGNNLFDFGNIIGSGNIVVNASMRITPNINSNNKEELLINHINSNINFITQNISANTKLDHAMITMGNIAGNGIVSMFVSNSGVMKDVVDITSRNISFDNRQYINYTSYAKYPEYPMNADSVNGYTVTTSSNYSSGGTTTSRFKLFDGNTAGSDISGVWCTDVSSRYNTNYGIYIGSASTSFINLSGATDMYYGEWAQLQLPIPQAFEYIKIFGRPQLNILTLTSPRNFIILGSNDGLIWNELQRYSNITNWVVVSPNLGKIFALNNKTAYLYYRLVVNRIGNFEYSTAQVDLNIAEIEFYTTTTTKISTPIIDEYPRFFNLGEQVQYISTTEQRSLFGNLYVYKSSSCSATSALVYGNTVPSYAFDGADTVTVFNSGATYSSGNSTGTSPITTYITGTNISSYSGEWIQIEGPFAVSIKSVTIFSLDNQREKNAPRDFAILGSNDNSTWYLINETKNVTSYTFNVGKTFNFNPSDKYKFFRLVVNKIFDNNIWENSVQIAYLFYTLTDNTKYPPTDPTSNISNGFIYTASSSKYNDIWWNIFRGFTSNLGEGWFTNASVYNSTSGNYIGGLTTSMILPSIIPTMITYAGEWLQLTIPDQICLTNYIIVSANSTLSPKDWIILGSTDESTWYLLDTELGITLTSGVQNNYYCPNSTYNSLSFRHFRLCVNKVSSGTSLQIASLKLYGYIPVDTGSIQLNTNNLNLGYTDYLYNKTELWCVKKSGNPFISASVGVYSIFDGSGDIIHNQFTGNPLLYGWRFDKNNNLPGGAFFVNTAGLYNVQCFIKLHSTESGVPGLIITYGKNVNNYMMRYNNALFINSNVNNKQSMCYSTMLYLNQGDAVWVYMFNTSMKIAQVRFSGYLVSV